VSTGPTRSRDEVFEQVRRLLGETLQRDPATIRPEHRLTEDLGAASVDFLTLVFELEDAFGRTLEDEELAGLDTVASVVDLLVEGDDADDADGADDAGGAEGAPPVA
jgi:acyl carrier protein